MKYFSFEYELSPHSPHNKEITTLKVSGTYENREDYTIDKILWNGFDIRYLLAETRLFDEAWEKINEQAEFWVAWHIEYNKPD